MLGRGNICRALIPESLWQNEDGAGKFWPYLWKLKIIITSVPCAGASCCSCTAAVGRRGGMGATSNREFHGLGPPGRFLQGSRKVSVWKDSGMGSEQGKAAAGASGSREGGILGYISSGNNGKSVILCCQEARVPHIPEPANKGICCILAVRDNLLRKFSFSQPVQLCRGKGSAWMDAGGPWSAGKDRGGILESSGGWICPSLLCLTLVLARKCAAH